MTKWKTSSVAIKDVLYLDITKCDFLNVSFDGLQNARFIYVQLGLFMVAFLNHLSLHSLSQKHMSKSKGVVFLALTITFIIC